MSSHEKVVAIIQARLGSTRLPGKSLMDVYPGLPLVKAVYDRTAAAQGIDEVVMATTSEAADDELATYANKSGWRVVRGSTDDVLSRFQLAAEDSQADVIVRITADDSFKDPVVTAQILRRLLERAELDYVSNTIKPTFPEGIDIEVFRRRALERAHREATLKSDREHVTPFIWRQSTLFKIENIEHSSDLSHLRWTIDYPEDLAFAQAVYQRLYASDRIFLMADILSLLEREPSVRELCTAFQRNKGYLESAKKEQSHI